MNNKEKQAIIDEVKKQGYSVNLLNSWPAKATYYKPSGEPLPNLPADPYSMRKYLRRGLLLAPPKQAEEPVGEVYEAAEEPTPEAIEMTPCPNCGTMLYPNSVCYQCEKAKEQSNKKRTAKKQSKKEVKV